MRPFTVNGEVWRVVRVRPGDPRLTDRTGIERLATCDPDDRSVYLSDAIPPPLLDRILLHEVAHAVTISYGLLGPLRAVVPQDLWVFVEEWACQLVENFGVEAAAAASESLGRPICVGGFCHDRP